MSRLEVFLVIIIIISLTEAWMTDMRRQFFLGFLNTDSILNPHLYFVSEADTNITISMFHRNRPHDVIQKLVERGILTRVELPTDVRMSGTSVELKGVEISSTGDVMILGGNGEHTDMFTVLDVEALSTHYMVSCLPDSLCQLGLVGVKDNTQVTLTWPEAIQQKQADLLTNITLHSHQSIQLDTHIDVTGLKVSASLSMAVFSGSQYKSSSEGGFTVSQQDQLLPVEYWGKTFVSLSFSETVDNTTDIYQIMASSNLTSINISLENRTQKLMLNEGQKYQLHFSSDTLLKITADHALSVIRYSAGNMSQDDTWFEVGPTAQDVSPTLNQRVYVGRVPPVEHSQEEFIFHTLGVARCQTLVIVINNGQTDGLMLNGQPLVRGDDSEENVMLEEQLNRSQQEAFCVVTMVTQKNDFTVVEVFLPDGYHTLSHQTSGVTFTAMSECYSLDRYNRTARQSRMTVLADLSSKQLLSSGVGAVRQKTSPDPTRGSYSHVTHTADKLPANINRDNVSSADEHGHLHVNLLQQPADVHTFKLERDNHPSVINFHETSATGWSGTYSGSLSSTGIALITSLASAIFLVIFCIIGFVVAEFVCKKENFTRAKVSPYIN